MSEPAAPARPFRRRLLANTAATGVSNLWTILLMVVSIPLLLDGLGPEAFGAWSLLQTFSTTTGWLSLADLGLAVAGTRFVAEAAAADERDRTRDLLGTLLALFAVVSVVGAVLLAAFGVSVLPALVSFPDDLVGVVRVSVVLFAVQCAFDQMTRGLQTALEGLQRVDLARGAEAVRRTLVIGGSAVAAQVSGDLSTTMAVAVVASAVSFVLTAGLTAHTVSLRGLTVSSRSARRLLAYGRTIAALRPLSVVQRTMDRFIVAIVLGPAAVGVVEVAAQVQNGAIAVMAAAGYAVLPGASWLTGRGDRHKLAELVTIGSRYTTLLTWPVAILPAILAGPLLAVWIGPLGGEAVVPVVLALAYVAITAPLHVGSELLLGVGQAGAILRAAAVAVPVNLAASITLVHLVGVPGAYLGTLVGALALFPPVTRAILREADLTLTEAVRRIVAPAIAPTAAMAAVAGAVVLVDLDDLATVVLGGVLGVATYGLVALRSSFAPGELTDLRHGLRRTPVASST